MTAAAILQYVILALQALPVVATSAEQVSSQLGSLTTQLKLFQSQNRDPSAEEWQALNAQLGAAMAALQAASAA